MTNNLFYKYEYFNFIITFPINQKIQSYEKKFYSFIFTDGCNNVCSKH